MAQTDITLRAGEASPTDVRLYATGTAAETAPILLYLCQTATQPSAPEISLTLRTGEASSTDIRLYSSSYTAASQDTDIILRPIGAPCGAITPSVVLAALEAADAFAGAVEVVTAASSDLALAALESPDVAAFALEAIGGVVAPPAVGGGSAKRPRRRHFVIGDKHVIADDRTDIEAVIAALVTAPEPVEIAPAKRVRSRQAVPAAAIAPEPAVADAVPLRVDWAALDALLRQSIRLEQPEVAAVIRDLRRRWDDDEDDAETLLLLT